MNQINQPSFFFNCKLHFHLVHFHCTPPLPFLTSISKGLTSFSIHLSLSFSLPLSLLLSKVLSLCAEGRWCTVGAVYVRLNPWACSWSLRLKGCLVPHRPAEDGRLIGETNASVMWVWGGILVGTCGCLWGWSCVHTQVGCLSWEGGREGCVSVTHGEWMCQLLPFRMSKKRGTVSEHSVGLSHYIDLNSRQI